ncbi:MAG TPA: porin family protein [Terriglobales bacterium]|nr:porin family protein [Terriglobales bacterium]
MTRRSIRTVVALALVLPAAAGLAVAANDVSIGIHGGLSIPDIRGSQTDVYSRNFTSREGPYFGLSLEKTVTPLFSLVAELNVTSQGGKRNGMQPITMDIGIPLPPDTILYGNFRNETILDYLEVPVLARFNFGHSRLRFFLNAGPYVGVLLRAKAVTRGSSLIYLDEAGTMPVIDTPVSFDAGTNVKDSLKSTNIGLYGGGGVKYPLGCGDLVLEAHFQLGLTTIQRDIATSGKSQTGAVVISLGYTLPLGRKE